MRVLLDGRRLTRRQIRGGADASWRQLLPALLDQAEDPSQFSILSASAYPWRTELLPKLAATGAGVHHHWASSSLLATLGRLGLRTEWLGPGQADILHLSHPRWFLRTSARVVVSVQSLLHHNHPQLFQPKQVARLEQGFLSIANRVCLWICTSEGTREDLVRLYRVPRGRTTVIFPGTAKDFTTARGNRLLIDRTRAKHGLDKRPYLVFLGALEPRKNLKNLVDGYEIALTQGLTSDLALVGPRGWKSESIISACRARPRLQDRMHFPGFLPQEEMAHVVAGAEAMVHPAYHEGTGITVLEAMAAGTPVLCSNRGALPEATGGNALLFQPNDPASIARTMLQIQEDQEQKTRLQSQGLAHALKYTWEQAARRTLQAYDLAMSLPA